MQIFVLKSRGIEIIPYPTYFKGIKDGECRFLAISSKGLGLNPAFLLDIDLCYSYIQPSQKLGFIVIIARHGFCRKTILNCSSTLETDLP